MKKILRRILFIVFSLLLVFALAISLSKCDVEQFNKYNKQIDLNVYLDALDILQNNKNVALGYLQQSVFLDQVCSTKATLKALISDQDYCNVVQATINNHSDTIVKTLSDVTPTSKTIGSGAGTWTYGVGEANIMIAYQCYDDSDTDYSVYHGNGAYRTAYVQRHSGNTNLANIICLRGIKLVGSGASIGNVSYKHYTL